MRSTILLKITLAMAVAAIVLDVLAVTIVHRQVTHHAAAKKAESCSTRQNLCIELDEADGGVVARFNDFRFDGKQCLYYRVLAPDAWQHYCGAGYKLKWIGPETQK